ncbi:GD23958 [Drosophila simulans]|uniref:GD23958 n=1 Tax=Drosophila simulans TaxID=7240 RepID=B4Q5I3_DROSI|nr:GD23958 [Drosophila simulans]
MSINKSIRSSRRTRRSLASGGDLIGPYIYCINFYNNGLSAVRDEFVKRLESGLRRAMFVIDLDKEVAEANYQFQRKSRTKKTGSLDAKSLDPLSIVLQCIQNCVEEFDRITKQIESESNFDLYSYWQRNIPAQLKNLLAPKKKGTPDTKRDLNTARSKTGKTSSDKVRLEKIKCSSVTAKEHNKVGKGVPVSKREYIRDNPTFTKMLILIVGQMDNDFYKMLMAYEQPLRAIIHFMPEESAYDILVPRPRREQQLQEALAVIQKDIHSLRKRTPTKPVGIFQQQLPQMSACMAAKFTDDIFDQLSWYMYDVETLREWYRSYYVDPYKETNIKMDPSMSLVEAFHIVESLSIQGHYLKTQMPASLNDNSTVYLYLESLMSTFGNPKELMTETEVLLLANPTPSVQTRVLDKVKVYANSFKSIVKLHKNDRIFVEEANVLLSNLISYMDQSLMRNVYHGCLEYNLLRRYFTSGYINSSLKCQPYNGDVEPIYLPKFAELYLTDDSVMQRITELVKDYDDFSLQEVQPNVHLYTFRRDFTQYEMENFLKDLVTPKRFNEVTESYLSRQTESADNFATQDPFIVRCNEENDGVPIDPKVFVRRKSIKEQLAKKREKEKKEQEESRAASRKVSVAQDGLLSSRTVRQSQARATIASILQAKDSTVDSKHAFFVGLGRNHPLLEGYNLDDTRQTIKCKTSKYFFEEGRIVLYEERWNFRQMNKCLALEIGGQEVHFRSADDPRGVTAADSSVRIESKNGISLRVLATQTECAKAVLNFPNGLSTYCHDTHTEHVWQYQENVLDESRRVCTPYGCVIAFYQSTDTIVIMRYNGEVYQLFTFTEADNEEEEDLNSEFINACSTQSTYSTYQPLREAKKKQRSCENSLKKSSVTRSMGGLDSIIRPSLFSVDSKKSQSSKKSIPGKRKSQLLKEQQAAALFESIKFELNYLNFIMALYKLSYRHLKLTTSLGSVVHVQRDGKIWCGKPYRNTEWHDYYANESYSMRDDGVKMVWTLGELRCYHSDGTAITSETVEGWDPGTDVDEIDMEISSSSSHANIEIESSQIFKKETIFINDPEGLPFKDVSLSNSPDAVSQRISLRSKEISSSSDVLPEEEEGEVDLEKSYITFLPNSYFIAHKVYAGIHFTFSHITNVDLHLETSIFTCDNLKVRVFRAPLTAGVQYSEPVEIPSSAADPDEWTKPEVRPSTKSQLTDRSFEETPSSEDQSAEDVDLDVPCVEIECSNLALTLYGDRVIIQTHLRKFGCDENAKCDLQVRDDIELKVNFAESLLTTFRNWVDELTSFINCFCPKRRTLYFLETQNRSCQRKGFELYKSVPPLGKYNLCAGNFFIDVNELISIYVEIPAQLANTDRIHQFVSEFDSIKFRKQRYRFNEAIMFHLYPRLQLLVQQEISKRSWKNHHEENRRRMFIEQQRFSLYMAMLKHKVYPSYFQFKDQFNSHVRNIEFFQFMTSKCNEKTHPDDIITDPAEEPSPPIKPKLKKNKCVCPKYIKSLD